MILSLLLSAGVDPEAEIVVTAAREPLAREEAPASVTLFGEAELDALALPTASDLLRLAPGVSVAASGPRGSQAQLRIRGAEANHTLLFVDGIRFNDPAAGNEARFELLAGDSLSRIEVVRGPQSALWGSEAIGGVIAAETPHPFRQSGLAALAEYGSLDTARLSGRYAVQSGQAGLAASGGWMRSDGIDASGAGGERDGFDHRDAAFKAVWRPADRAELGLVGHWISGTSQFDGFDPVTFRRADTLDETDNRIAALGGWASAETEGWSGRAQASLLDSSNRNRLGDEPLNRTAGRRLALGGQLSRIRGAHRLTTAVEHESEDFRARDQAFFGATDQDRSRDLTAFVAQWRARWNRLLTTDIALRRDSFSAFKDSTSLRAALLLRPAPAWTLHAGYGEGIAQPSFYDLHGFFPGSFVGNPELRPERSRGWEAGIAWRDRGFHLALVGHWSRLEDEIVDVFDPVTFLSSTANADGRSRRRGIEIEAGHALSERLTVGVNYSFLDAGERQVAGLALVREARRPRHSANLFARGEGGRMSWGAAFSYVGARRDLDFDDFPASEVRLGAYLLGSARIGWRVLPQIEAFARVENAFDSEYQDVAGYHTAGRTVHAGLRFLLGR